MAFLKRICGLEGVEADEDALRTIAVKSEGDMRSAINDLQTLIRGRAKLKASDAKQLGFRDRQTGASDTLEAIFTARTIREALRAERDSQLDPETLVQAVHDNLPVRFTDSLRLAEAYDAVSRADVFFGRIRHTQDWGLLPYAMENLMRGVVSPPGEEGVKLSYRFPPWKWIVLSRTRAIRALRDDVCRRIGEKCHVSRRVAGSEHLPYLRIIFQSNIRAASEIASWLRLEEEEIRFLSGEKVGKVDRKGGGS
jgi:replication factor C large subunit